MNLLFFGKLPKRTTYYCHDLGLLFSNYSQIILPNVRGACDKHVYIWTSNSMFQPPINSKVVTYNYKQPSICVVLCTCGCHQLLQLVIEPLTACEASGYGSKIVSVLYPIIPGMEKFLKFYCHRLSICSHRLTQHSFQYYIILMSFYPN